MSVGRHFMSAQALTKNVSLQTPVKLTDGYYRTDGHFTMIVLKVC